MTKKEREAIFDKYDGKCTYCGCELQKGWHVDHIEPIVRNWWNGTCERPENENVANYTPSCASCNIMKGSGSVENFRIAISNFIESLNKYSTQYKFAKRYGLVIENPKPIKFYFETLMIEKHGKHI